MTQINSATSTAAGESVFAHQWRLAMALAKPGIVKMVTITAAVGFALGALALGIDASIESVAITALGMLLGTVLSAAGANTLNQAIEHRRDAMMRRTERRPIPAGAITPPNAWALGLAESVLGVTVLLLLTGPAPALVSATTILTYLAWYTPLKPRTSFSTIVGALPGALPPLIGWSAIAGGSLSTLVSPAGWALVAIVFVWQMPHFLAIAWMYRDDYASGGYRVLPVEDPSGFRTGLEAVLWSALLIPVSLAPALWIDDVVGPVAIGIALLAGIAFLWKAVCFLIERTDARARSLFFASIIYLPVVLIALVADALVRALL